MQTEKIEQPIRLSGVPFEKHPKGRLVGTRAQPERFQFSVRFSASRA